jgi:hypothetical protein
MTPPVVRRLEAAAGRNLADYVAALRRVAPELGAECIDIAGGVAAFTGIGSPLTTVKGVWARSCRHVTSTRSKRSSAITERRP